MLPVLLHFRMFFFDKNLTFCTFTMTESWLQGVLPIILLLLTFSETSLTASFAQPANDCSSYFLQSNSSPQHNSGRFSPDTGTLTMDPSRVIFHLLSQIFLLFTPYYRNLATFDLLSRRYSQFPRHSEKQAVALLLTHTHLSRELFIPARSGTSLICVEL